MESELGYRLAADALLGLHALLVVFIVLGLALVIAGKLAGWGWVHHFWFRVAHLVAIGIVALQAWLGMICPLTLWEMQLREKAGDAVYAGSFIAHWLDRLLYYRAPEWVFVVGYSLFAALVLASWFWVRPQRRRRP